MSRDIPHEDVCPDQSDFHQSPFSSSLSEDLGTLQPTSCLHVFSSSPLLLFLASTSSPWPGKTKYPISDDYLRLLSEKSDSRRRIVLNREGWRSDLGRDHPKSGSRGLWLPLWSVAHPGIGEQKERNQINLEQIRKKAFT